MENRNLTQDYNVTRSPTVKIFGLNKKEPENYTGHRQRTELVKYINDYAEKHSFKEDPPVPETAKYYYNIDSIV